MRLLKKLSILLALCIASVLVFTACGSKDGGNEKQDDQTEDVTTADVGYPEPELTSDTYTNKALKLKMTVPSTWDFYSKEELASEYNDGAMEPVSGKSFYEAYGIDPSGTLHNNISIIVQYVPDEADTIRTLGIEEFAKFAADAVPDSLTEVGADSIEYDVVKVDFPLDEYACIQFSYQLQGVSIDQRQFVTLVGDYLYSITLTALDEAGVKELTGYFSSIK